MKVPDLTLDAGLPANQMLNVVLLWSVGTGIPAEPNRYQGAKMTPHESSIPVGLCECGCGKPAPVATKTSSFYGWIKGKPKRFISGHNGNQKKGPSLPVVYEEENCVAIDLGRSRFAFVGEEDADLAEYRWGMHSNGYACRWSKRKGERSIIFLHNAIAVRKGFEHPDHENRNKLDCRRSNLRPANRFENGQNYPIRKDNTSGVRGVSMHPCGKFQVAINAFGKRVYLGLAATLEEGARIRKEASDRLHREFAGQVTRDE